MMNRNVLWMRFSVYDDSLVRQNLHPDRTLCDMMAAIKEQKNIRQTDRTLSKAEQRTAHHASHGSRGAKRKSSSTTPQRYLFDCTIWSIFDSFFPLQSIGIQQMVLEFSHMNFTSLVWRDLAYIYICMHVHRNPICEHVSQYVH